MTRKLLILAMAALAVALQLPSGAQAEPSTSVLVDDFVPQPVQGDQFWFYNRLGGDRGQLDGPGSEIVDWGQGIVTATITEGTSTWVGVWTSLNHPITENVPLDFSAIFPSQIVPAYQGIITELRVGILDGQGTYQAELQAPD